MASKFYSNSILMGTVDFYCLACDSYLRSEEDGIMHIEKPIHKKNLDSALYVEKYPNERIRKVKKGYHCEFCNLLIPTVAKVNLHVNEHMHNNKKGTNLLKRVGNSVIAFQDVAISETAWNGFIDHTCVICNIEFDNEDIHKAEQMHLLSLVQSKLEFGVNDSIYRKVDDSLYQCLTCNTVLLIATMPSHSDNAQHKELYEKCRDNTHNVAPAPEPEKIPDESQDRQAKIEPIPLHNERKPTTQKTKKPAEKASKTDIVDPDARFIELLDAKDYIMRNSGSLWCILCEWNLDNAAVVGHVTSQHHQTLLKLHKARIGKQEATSKKKAIQPVDTHKEEVLATSNKKAIQPVDTHKEEVLATSNKKAIQPVDTHEEVLATSNKKAIQPVDTHEEVLATSNKKAIQPVDTHEEVLATSKKETIQPVDTHKEEVLPDQPVDRERAKLVDSLSKYQSCDINIDFFSSTAYCRKCSKDIDFVSDAIDSHIEQHQKKNKKGSAKFAFSGVESTQNNTDGHILFTKPVFINKDEDKSARPQSNSVTSLIDEEVENFAKRNNMSISRIDNKVRCDLCDTQVPTSLKSMKEHISGGAHKNKRAKQSDVVDLSKPSELTQQSSSDTLSYLTSIDSADIKTIAFNDQYALSIHSFFFMTKQNFGYKCEVCNVTIAAGQIDDHKRNPKHNYTTVTVSLFDVDSEFIRVPRPGVYHCGFCNTVENNWSDMVAHLSTTGHRENKVAAEWRMREYLPDIRREERHSEMESNLWEMLMRQNIF